jgi:hypothetical protein
MSILPLQVTCLIDYKIPSPLERGEGEGEGLIKPRLPLTPALSPAGGEGDFQAASQVS